MPAVASSFIWQVTGHTLLRAKFRRLPMMYRPDGRWHSTRDQTQVHSVLRDGRTRYAKLDHNVLLCFYRLPAEQSLCVAPFANRAYCRLREQTRAVHRLDALYGSITTDNNV